MSHNRINGISFLIVILLAVLTLTGILMFMWSFARYEGSSFDISGAVYCVAIHGIISLPLFWLSTIINREIIIKVRKHTSLIVSIIAAAIFTMAFYFAVGVVFDLLHAISLVKLHVIIKLFVVAGFFMGLAGAAQDNC